MTSETAANHSALDRWSVCVTYFPFTDRELGKRRPVLVLTASGFHEHSGHAICAMITSGLSSVWPLDVAIGDLGAAGLQRPCVVRAKIFTIPLDHLSGTVGLLGQADAQTLTRTWAGLLPWGA